MYILSVDFIFFQQDKKETIYNTCMFKCNYPSCSDDSRRLTLRPFCLLTPTEDANKFILQVYIDDIGMVDCDKFIKEVNPL